MALAETAKLVVNLSLAGNFSSAIGKAGKSLDTFGTKVDRTESRAYRAGQQIGTGIKRGAAIAAVGVGLLASQVALGLQSLIDLEKATTQTEAVIKSTGKAAGVTADQVRNLAEKYESLNATVGDEVIQSGENLLLTFTNIKNKAFEPTLQAALDMNQALGKGADGLTGTVRILGKALNDPTKGLSALGRVGVTFTKDQVKKIKSLQKEGKLYEAQSIILKELEKRFGGSFLAGGGTTEGKVAKFTDSIEDLQRALADALLPTLGNIADELSDFLRDPEVVRGVKDLGKDIAGLFSKDNIKEGARVLGGFLQTAKDVAPVIAGAAKTAASVIGTAVKLFQSLPPEIQSLAVAGFAVNKLTGGLVTNIAGGIFGALKAMTVQAAVVNVNGGVVNGGGPSVPGGAGGAAAGAGAVGAGFALSAIAAAVATSVIASLDYRDNHVVPFENKGLTPAEIQAQQYYTTDKANQQQIIKHLGHMPTKADFESGLAKLTPNTGTEHHEGKQKDDLVPATKKGTQQAIKDAAKQAALVSKVQKSVDHDRAETVAKLGVLKMATNSVGRDARDAGTRVTGATDRASGNIVGAIRANRPIINVSVSSTSITKVTEVTDRYGNTNGSRNKNQGSGTKKS